MASDYASSSSSNSLWVPFPRARQIGAQTTYNLLWDEIQERNRNPKRFPYFDNDGPGHLSSKGPRHDNDHVDYRMIRILPTTDEILAVDRPVYMPKKDIDDRHHHLPHRLSRLLDTQFRHLRYDSTEAIRDICYDSMQNLVEHGDSWFWRNHYDFTTDFGNRYCSYVNAQVEGIVPSEKNGIMINVSFYCPEDLRGQRIHKSGRLDTGKLCALIVHDKPANEVSILYFDIHLRQSTFAMNPKGINGSKAAVQLSIPSDTSQEEILQIMRLANNLCPDTKLRLIEFPNVLRVGFHHPLQCLQKIRPDDISFGPYLAPDVKDALINGNHMTILPPKYATHPGYNFDLTTLTSDKSEAKFPPDAFKGRWLQWTLEFIMQRTTLDEGQAIALCNSLSRELAFTQGPPGTGKTFLGVALTQALLASRPPEDKKPILVVCLTNHALDGFMAGLRDAGVENLLRIGNGSKEDWTKAINLYQKGRNYRYKNDEHQERQGMRSQKTHLFNEISNWCNAVSKKLDDGRPAWVQIAPILRQKYPQSYIQFTTDTDSTTAQAFTFDYWAGGGDLIHIKNLHQELVQRFIETSAHHVHHLQKHLRGDSLQDCDANKVVLELLETISSKIDQQSTLVNNENLWHLSYEKRQTLIAEWSAHIDDEASARELAFLQTQHQELDDADKNSRKLKDVRVMQKQDVIGITTTACAARRDLLCDLAPDILICEEAGEVLEAHALCSLIPSLKQAIFIGDPLQLRPEINERMLTLETTTGAQYRLDESLFERFMAPRNPDAPEISTSQLNIQRRMHPQIADICRLTYPFLKDHESTLAHPIPKGLTERIFWLDHREPEAIDTINHTDSFHNPHEVNVIKAFVQYLMRGSEYSLGDIAVLTPYTAQLKQLTTVLASTCSIWLSPKDRELLLDGGQIDIEEEDSQAKTNVAMSEMLRIATVDNFQGDEARVIILSTVRSGGKAGFLKIENRINVACSRARDGFYVVGNAETLQQVPMWNNVINIFNKGDRLGPQIKLQCDRHSDHEGYATNPADFEAFPECSKVCNITLPCGHSCTEACHDIELHALMPCKKPCRKSFDCGHTCQKLCSMPCGRCEIGAEDLLLPCGHIGKRLCSGVNLPCDYVVDTKSLPCNRHKLEIVCSRQDQDFVCEETCGESLMCGHLCTDSCNQCNEVGEHRVCAEECQKALQCGHSCKKVCHTGQDCPPCMSQCTKGCTHGRCDNLCSKPCDPCIKVSNTTTEASTEKIMCCLQNTSDPADVIDRLLLKFATKFDSLACALENEQTRLGCTMYQLMADVQMNPLGARGNTDLLLRRERKLIDIQHQVVTYKSNVLNIALHSVEILKDLPIQYVLMSRLRFDDLEFRVVNVRLRDKLRIAQELLDRSSEDSSEDIARQAISMIQFVYTECIACIYHCQAAIEDPRLITAPCLETEIRLHQARLRLLAHEAESTIQKQGMDSMLRIKCNISDSAFFKSLSRVRWIYQHDVALKPFVRFIEAFARLFYPSIPGRSPPSCSYKSFSSPEYFLKRREKRWINHQLGHLVVCSKFNHPYSKESFPEYCPDCGRWQDTEEELYKKDQARLAREAESARKHLHEDAFLQTMRENNPSCATQTELTPEEKFLEVLKKMKVKK